MKILHSKPRNRLTEDRVDKLLFIQINLRTLRRRKQQQREPQSEEIDESESEDGMDASRLVFDKGDNVSIDNRSLRAIIDNSLACTSPLTSDRFLSKF
jgi:hypothetical protein